MFDRVLGAACVAGCVSMAAGAEIVPGSFDYDFGFVGSFVDVRDVAFDLYTFDVTNVTDEPITAFDSLGFSGLLAPLAGGSVLGTSINTAFADSYFIGGSLVAPGRNVDDGGVLSASSIADLDTVFVDGLATQTVAQLAVTPGTVPVFDGGQAFGASGKLVGTPPRSPGSAASIYEWPGFVRRPVNDLPADPPLDESTVTGESLRDRFSWYSLDSYWTGDYAIAPVSSGLPPRRNATESDVFYSWRATLESELPIVNYEPLSRDWRGPVAHNANHVIFERTSVVDTRYRADIFGLGDAVVLTDLTATSALQTPEPGSAGLVAAGVLVWGLRRSRRAG